MTVSEINFVAALSIVLVAGCDAAFTDLRPKLDTPSATDAENGDATGTPQDVGDPPDSGGEWVDAGTDSTAEPPVETIVAQGTFEPRADYGGEGTASLVRLSDGRWEVRLGDDFAVGSLPGPTVILARENSLGSTLDPARGDLELGVLETNDGASVYAVPGDAGDRRIVWIYCKPFGLEVAAASLEAP